MIRTLTYLLPFAIGCTWGFLWTLIIGLLFVMITGDLAMPNLTAATLAGAVIAIVLIFKQISDNKQRLLISAFTFVVCYIIFSLFSSDYKLADIDLSQGFALIVIIGIIVWSLHKSIAEFVVSNVSRYHLENLFIRTIKGVGLVIFTVVVFLPFYVMLMTSFKSQQLLLANPLDFSIDFSQGFSELFDSYIQLFSEYHFGSFLLNTFIVSAGTVILTLIFAVPGAYAVARMRFPGQQTLSQSILLIYMIPAIILVIPLYAVFSKIGLRNSLIGLLIVYPATTIPVALYMLQGYFRGLPFELEEAGLMDGLKRVGVIIKITLPLALPALASVSLYVFMIAWNEFLFAFMFLDNIEIFTLSRGVVSLNSSEVPRQYLMAAAVVATVPVLVLFLVCERFLVSGLTAGSVKG